MRPAFVAPLLVQSLTNLACAQWYFSMVASNSTPIPSGSGMFTTFNAPVLGGGRVVFTPGSAFGVYTNMTGTLTRLADTSTAIPGSSSTFAQFGSPFFDGSLPIFRGTGTGVGGAYSADSGIVMIADTHTQVPEGGGTFSFAWVQPSGIVARRGPNAIFLAGFVSSPPFSGATGLYRWNAGTLATLVNLSTPVPGSSAAFRSFTYTSMSTSAAAIVGTDTAGGHGIWTVPLVGGPLTTIVDTTTPIPAGTGTFGGFGTVSMDGPNIAFGAGGPPAQVGTYAWLDGALIRIADLNTTAPEGGLFISLNQAPPSISGHNIVFEATNSAGRHGIYAWRSGVITRVVSESDTLGGLPVGSLFLSTEAIDGDTIAFSFTSGTQAGALYTATYLPPPCYPNCDNSTTAPVLNINDFICFLNRFAAADTYANCDNSTTPPVLNVLDFGCFLNRFAAGCP